ncbi:fumarylacetoacetate hydrolase family protein [Leptospira sp. 2 VSF19]|uniref:Fumarylacetoacetate hydrolase family protein n=1 Tax=Leptospira soteropolitanensis TaxID=2950025 RepID=A0AAW5V8M9_9LEPT|nr:fumarylacetoacetate hydrolase family protein [Leptospira soteropolitanensis]MCW7491200.1 fumarylacetoacetate hydrolase family protein [Leptospira soteropolitanensis]MCW7498784.1 fumarylacetoacetate hydrolase family protein [Leptospira soteropolitanensis]MCW7521623.1 fumarylacetoacetate hydrolase family protein [Leptospira soteropolitanensis]MCW7524888.1 fumarylacetoacetate hydrolase family protein [Leptospira soteropolitanensis]MCW7528755.1 fumarylacetoacetate hydrolase family protein [Lept
MAKNFVRFQYKNQIDWGMIANEEILPLHIGDLTTKDLLVGLQKKRIKTPTNNTTQKTISKNKITILSPITAPCQVICQGANYKKHSLEAGLNPKSKTYNLFFTKSDVAITTAIGDVIRPKHVELLDYEIELGIIFGKEINEDLDLHSYNPKDYITALFIANDISARDIQLPQLQWYKGKSYRTFFPAGPILAVLEPNDFDQMDLLELNLTVNGQVRQSAKANQMVYPPKETIAELSRFARIQVGDVLLTGTPSGCALQAPGKLKQIFASFLPEHKKWEVFIKGQKKRKEYLQPGDKIKATIRTSDGMLDLGEQILLVKQG